MAQLDCLSPSVYSELCWHNRKYMWSRILWVSGSILQFWITTFTVSSTLQQLWVCYLPNFVGSDGTVGLSESCCVPRVVLTQPEVHVKSNTGIVSQWVNDSVLYNNFHYLDHVKTALGMHISWAVMAQWACWVLLCPWSCAATTGSTCEVEYCEAVDQSFSFV